MARKVVIQDSGAVRSYARQLRQAAEELDRTAAKLRSATHAVRASWDDPQQRRVEDSIDQLARALHSFRAEAEQTSRYCEGLATQVESIR